MPIALFWFTFWVVTFWVVTLAGGKLYARPVSAVADGGGAREGQKTYYVRDYIIMYYVSVYVIIYYIIAYVIPIGTASTRDCVSPPAFCSTVVILPSKALPKGQAALLFPVAVPIRYDLTQRTPPERPLCAVSAARIPSVHETAERAPIRGDFVVTAYTTGPAVPGVEELPLYV